MKAILTEDKEVIITLTQEEAIQLRYNLYLAHKAAGFDRASYNNAVQLRKLINPLCPIEDKSKHLTFKQVHMLTKS